MHQYKRVKNEPLGHHTTLKVERQVDPGHEHCNRQTNNINLKTLAATATTSLTARSIHHTSADTSTTTLDLLFNRPIFHCDYHLGQLIQSCRQ